MPKDSKNKAKTNVWLKQGAFLILVVLWLLAIFFKHEFTGTMKIITFVVLLLLTIGELFWLNRSLLDNHHQDKN